MLFKLLQALRILLSSSAENKNPIVDKLSSFLPTLYQLNFQSYEG